MTSTQPDSPVHLIFSSVGGYGHTRILRILAQGAAAHGHRVIYLCSGAFRDSIEAAIPGVEFVQFHGKANIDENRVKEYFEQVANVPDDERILYDMKYLFLASLPDEHDAFQAVLRRLKGEKVVIVADPFNMGTLPMQLGAKDCVRVPTIGIGHLPLLSLSIDTAPLGFGLPPQTQAKNQELNAQAIHSWQDVYQYMEGLIRRYQCAMPLPSKYPMDNIYPLHDIYLQCCLPEMEYPRSDLLPSIRFVGAVTGQNDRKGIPDWFQSFVIDDQSHPLILVTSGTIATSATELIVPTLQACAALPVRVLVCAVHLTLPSDFQVPENARIAEWIPFEDALPYVSIMISSGGYGGICQAFAAGVPMIVAGIYQDKLETTARAAMTGAAINLKTTWPSVDSLHKAVQQMLDDDSYKKNAMRLKAHFDKLDAVKLTLEAIDEVVQKYYG